MEKSQIDNIIKFCFNFHKDMDVDWVYSSPDYILEKWDKYINQRPKLIYYYNNEKISKWIKNWSPSEEELYRLRTILLFLYKINQRRFNNLKLSELLDEFEKTTGIYIEDVNKDNYDGLHELLKQQVDKWLNLKENKREYKLLQIL